MQLPEEFSCQMRELLSESDFQKFCEALNNESCTSVRFNPFKDPDNNASKSLDLGGNVAWSSCGKYLNSRPNFSLNPLFHSGAFYVQEASSMFLEQAISQCGSPRVVLDLCAAPGGKSTLLRSLLPD